MQLCEWGGLVWKVQRPQTYSEQFSSLTILKQMKFNSFEQMLISARLIDETTLHNIQESKDF